MPNPYTDSSPLPGHPLDTPHRPWGMDENVFSLLLHLSPLAGFVIPIAGLVLPLIMWLTQKNENPRIDAHGRVVINWMLSSLIYVIASAILSLVIIGIFTMIATLVCNLVFIVIGAVKASKGETWVYPLSIPFLGRPQVG